MIPASRECLLSEGFICRHYYGYYPLSLAHPHHHLLALWLSVHPSVVPMITVQSANEYENNNKDGNIDWLLPAGNSTNDSDLSLTADRQAMDSDFLLPTRRSSFTRTGSQLEMQRAARSCNSLLQVACIHALIYQYEGPVLHQSTAHTGCGKVGLSLSG